MFNFPPYVWSEDTAFPLVTVTADLGAEQIHTQRIQDVSDVAGHRCEHRGAPRCSVDLIVGRQTSKNTGDRRIFHPQQYSD